MFTQLSAIEEVPSMENESAIELRVGANYQKPSEIHQIPPRSHQLTTARKPKSSRSKPSAEEEELEAMINLTKITTYQEKICLVLHEIG